MSQQFRPFEIHLDTGEHLLQIAIGGAILAYVAVIFNVIVFVVLSRKNLISPATILMQGLAVADGLTSLFAYGLEPLFQVFYKPLVLLYQTNLVTLDYPYCALYVHSRFLSDDFHFVSLLLTTCIGVQKCIALKFPIWTRIYLTNRKAVVACILCFVISASINAPRYFGIEFNDELQFFSTKCGAKAGRTASYALVEHTITTIILIMILCLLLTICTIYIIYKLITNTFQGRHTEKRKQERRSIVMVALVLVVFFISEVPRILINSVMIHDISYLLSINKWEIEQLITFIMDERLRMAAYLHIGVNINFNMSKFLVEGMKLLTLCGCMSNFIIYLTTSQKMRNEIRIIMLKCNCKRRLQLNRTLKN